MKLLFFACVILPAVMLAQFASAVSVPDAQKSIDVVAEIGGHSDTYLVIQGVFEDTNVTAYGDKSAWVSFGSDGAAYSTVRPSLMGGLVVRVSVPGDAQLGSYGVDIMAGGSAFRA
jgi:hypothetical protein